MSVPDRRAHPPRAEAAPKGYLFLLVLNVLALGGAFSLAVHTRARLPETYPAHWNLAGEVNRYASSSSGEWWILPITAAVMAALMVGCAYLVKGIPAEYINVPRKARFLAMSVEAQAGVRLAVGRYLLWLSLLCTGLFAGIQWLMYLSARQEPMVGAIAAVIGYVAVLLVYMVVGVIRLGRTVGAAEPPGQ